MHYRTQEFLSALERGYAHANGRVPKGRRGTGGYFILMSEYVDLHPCPEMPLQFMVGEMDEEPRLSAAGYAEHACQQLASRVTDRFWHVTHGASEEEDVSAAAIRVDGHVLAFGSALPASLNEAVLWHLVRSLRFVAKMAARNNASPGCPFLPLPDENMSSVRPALVA